MSEVGTNRPVPERCPPCGTRLPAGPLAGLWPAPGPFRRFGFHYETTLAKTPGTRFTRVVSALGSAIASTACPYQRLAQGRHRPRQRHRSPRPPATAPRSSAPGKGPNYQLSTLNPINQRACLRNPMKIRPLPEVSRA
jgi:hypothetical protein